MNEATHLSRQEILAAMAKNAENPLHPTKKIRAKITEWKNRLSKEQPNNDSEYTKQQDLLTELVNLNETVVEDANIENGPAIEGVDPTAAQGEPETNEQTENQSETSYLAVVEGAENDDFETFQDTTSVTTAETSPQINTKTELSQAEKQRRTEKLNKLGISVEQLTNETLQSIESSPHAEESVTRLGIKYNGNDCFMKIVSRDRTIAETHIDNNSYGIKLQQLTGGKEFNPLDYSFEGSDVETQTELAKAAQYHSEQTKLLAEKDSLAHMSVVIYSPSSTQQGEKTILGYSDFIVHKDDQNKVVVEAPVRALNLGSERNNEPGFNNPLYNALDINEKLRGSGLGQFLVEIGSNIAAKRYGATERVFATDSTDRGEGSFYVNKLGAHLEQKTPYGKDKAENVPVMDISDQTNVSRTWPFLQKVKWT